EVRESSRPVGVLEIRAEASRAGRTPSELLSPARGAGKPGCGVRAPRSGRPTLDLTGKLFLTYIGRMVGTADREQAVFGAISHPARRRMLDLLVEADRSVNAIAQHFQMSRPAVSQHLRILLDAGLVTEQRHGRERRYHLVPARLGPVRDWIAHYERF